MKIEADVTTEWLADRLLMEMQVNGKTWREARAATIAALKALIGTGGRPGMKIEALEARHKRQEALARLIVADKMGLLADPFGLKLPDELWQPYLAHAAGVLILIRPSEYEP